LRGAENAVPLHVGITCTSGGRCDLSFETVLLEYLQFPYKCFLLVLFRVKVANFALQRIPEGKKSQGLRSVNVLAKQQLVLMFLFLAY
jgi:hypothetical protein